MKLPENWDLPQVIRDRFGLDSVGRQRCMIEQEHIVLILHRVPERGKHEREAVLFWRRPDGDWFCSVRGNGLPCLRAHVEAYEEAQAAIDRAYDEAKSAEDYFRILEWLSPLKRAAANLHLSLQAAREAAGKDRGLISLRDRASDIDRTLDILYIDTRNALDYAMAERAEAQAAAGERAVLAAHRLNLIAAVFLPLTAISGIFGMNMHNNLEAIDETWPFWLVLLFGLGLGLVLGTWVSRPPKSPEP